MAIEIERKFLIRLDRLPPLTNGLAIQQAYVPTANGTTVRIRVAGDQAYMGIKTPAIRFSRREYEYPIPMDDALEMLEEVCHLARIEKQRFLITQDDLTWEIDVFGGENSGLIIAEIELDSENRELDLPDWVEAEVTFDPRYSNHSLSLAPFNTW